MKTLDRTYIAATIRAYRRARRVDPRCTAWSYTHAWRELSVHRKYLASAGGVLYASVHNDEEAKEAAAMGYCLAIDAGTPPERGAEERV